MKLKAKPLVSMVCALAMCAAMLPAQVLADNQPEETPASTAVSSTDKSVTIDKTASDEYLNTSLETNVTLTVSGQETKDKVAVLFLLDKSTSQGMRDEAAGMLDELAKKTNTDILYNVVIFSGTATATSWNDIQDSETLDSIKANFVNGVTSSGTNMDAGIQKAMQEMDTLPEGYDTADTYLVTLSDGITYVWTGDDGATKSVPVDGLNAAGTDPEVAAQTGADTWSMMYEYGVSLRDIYGEDAVSTGIVDIMNAFKEKAVARMQNTIEGGHVQTYPDATHPIHTYVYDDEKTAEVAAQYACGADFAIYESATGYENLAKRFTYSYAYAVPEAKSDGSDNTTNWENYPWGRELMEYCHALSSNPQDGFEVSNADAAEMFASIKNQIMYTIESGSITDVIGSNFDLASLNSFTLTVGGVEMDKVVNTDSNTVTFYAPDDSQHTTALYTLTYDPSNASGEQFTLAINTPVEKDKPLNLTYTVKLVNVEQEAGVYSVPTNESATLTYQPSVGGTTETLTFPVPYVKYRVAQVRPADITIYQGGNNGYEGVMGDTEISGSDSLPEPGYYINLPEDVNAALKEAGLSDGDTPAELSKHISISTADEQSKWSIASYGKTYSQALGQYIYAITPDKDTETAPFRLNFIAEDGEVYDEDNFSPAEYGALNATYTMQIYPELVNSHQVVITVTVGDNTYSCIMTTKTGDLNIRYVTGDQESVVTSSFTSVEEASKEDNPNKTALDKAYVIRDEDTKFFINNSDVDVTETEGFADVSLLFDDIVTDGNTEGASDYYSMLTDKAVDEAAEGMQDVKYEAKYLDLVDANNGNVWLTPSEKVTIYWPYPDGTDANTTFKLVHFKDLDREMNLEDVAAEIESAEIETLTVTTDAYGISFQTDSFSPYVLLWDNSQSTTVVGTPTPDEHPDIAEAIANGTWGQPTPTPAPAVIPQTSDDMPITLLIGAAGIAAAGIVVLVILRKRKRNQ